MKVIFFKLNLQSQLTHNDRYRQISHIEEKLSDMIANNRALQMQLEQHRSQFAYGDLQKNAEKQLAILMDMLRTE